MESMATTGSYALWPEPEPSTTGLSPRSRLTEGTLWPEEKWQPQEARDASPTSQYDEAEIDEEFSPYFAKLRAIKRDPSLWVEGAEPPIDRALFWAKITLRKLADSAFLPTKVVATAEGGVAICFRKGDKYADIECFNDGAILGGMSDGRNFQNVWEVEQSARGIARASGRIRGFLASSQTPEDDKR